MSFNLDVVPPSRRTTLSVIAGHFQWGVWDTRGRTTTSTSTSTTTSTRPLSNRTLGSVSVGSVTRLDPARLDVACLVMLREPVDRTISYYYERVYPSVKTKLNELSEGDLLFVMNEWIGSAHSRYRDEGLANTACRMMAGVNYRKGVFPNQVRCEPRPRSTSSEWEQTGSEARAFPPPGHLLPSACPVSDLHHCSLSSHFRH